MASTGQLTATILPAGATNKKVLWSSDNESVAVVNPAGIVTSTGGGTAKIAASSVDGNKTDYCEVTVNVIAGPSIPVSGVEISPSVLDLFEGETGQALAFVTPSNASNPLVFWSSDNPNVASIDQKGNITAKNEGTAIITVTTLDGGKTASITVTVSSNQIHVTGVTLSQNTLSLIEGNTQQLAAVVSPSNATNKGVQWHSIDENIATVDQSGLVTAVKEGNTTIVVITNDKGYQDTCAVTVAKKIIPVTGISLNKTSISITIGGYDIVTATIAPSGATNQNVVWSADNYGLLYLIPDGLSCRVQAYSGPIYGNTATVTVKTEDGNYQASCTVNIQEQVIPVTGITVTPSEATLYI